MNIVIFKKLSIINKHLYFLYRFGKLPLSSTPPNHFLLYSQYRLNLPRIHSLLHSERSVCGLLFHLWDQPFTSDCLILPHIKPQEIRHGNRRSNHLI